MNWKPENKQTYFYIENGDVCRGIWKDTEENQRHYMAGVLFNNRLDATFALDGVNEVFETPVDEDDLGDIGELVEEDCIDAEFEVVES